ncbi:MAG: helix-turn-helix domain-containing protein [Clostridiales bacterium]
MKRKKFVDNNEILDVVEEIRNMVDKLNNIKEEPLDIQAAADFLKVSADWMRDNYKKYKIPFHKPAGKIYFYKSELNSWIRMNSELEETILDIARKAAANIRAA